jgi:hypothetical protein
VCGGDGLTQMVIISFQTFVFSNAVDLSRFVKWNILVTFKLLPPYFWDSSRLKSTPEAGGMTGGDCD